ncbi:MAG: class I SAM-dependent rRNA methyltransferase [Bacteroidia bacterium]|nr:class I SAM-dependent rRNA methyltransferase [Bacteroidia bacterium]
MSPLPLIMLRSGKEEGPRRRHPWIFSGAVAKKDPGIKEGDAVEVRSSKNDFLGIGHFSESSIMVRLFCFNLEDYGDQFWEKALGDAIRYRYSIGLGSDEKTNAYRLVFGEGDGLPGLIIDLYAHTAVIQCHTFGMWNARQRIAEALHLHLDDRLKAVYDKSADTLQKRGLKVENTYLTGAADHESLVRENGYSFRVDWEQGQKTGFFLDQRDNRNLLSRYCRGKRVLNTFSYTGGFSVYAMMGGASRVDSVDVSERAIVMAQENMRRNDPGYMDAGFHTADTFDYFEQHEGEHDVIVLDPPAFAKHHDARHQAVMGYKRLNTEAIRKIRKGGILFTFSCSGVVDRILFESTVRSAAINARRNVRIMHHLSHPADHPASIFHPEGEYLKGLALFVE